MEKNNGRERKTNRFHRGQIIRAAINEALESIVPKEPQPIKEYVEYEDIGIGSIALGDISRVQE